MIHDVSEHFASNPRRIVVTYPDSGIGSISGKNHVLRRTWITPEPGSCQPKLASQLQFRVGLRRAVLPCRIDVCGYTTGDTQTAIISVTSVLPLPYNPGRCNFGWVHYSTSLQFESGLITKQ
ncbi:uncharacterized protein LOC111268261 [Varroa jacobsoni]|uniref:uncharacterized protein LOC111268261 n=1 Tax=Varroa jacobsoni TaxID=62625 RepID=UPI000BF33C65|nr:uncharacterized protein LOC111268261 [Varroa jacobsoni]